MAYYTKVLQPDETVKEIGRMHWSIYWPSVFFALIAIAIFVVGEVVAVEEPQRTYCLYAAAAIGAIAVLVFLAEWLRRRSTEIVVTDRRVIYKRGLLSRYTVEMNVARIETVDVQQGIGGRIFNYGTLLIRGTGAGIEPLRGVGGPIRLRNAIVLGEARPVPG
ncbi:MAG TPA: PH domain-containing protein [Acetobacteraceae bacterium]|nr:PH domain-containing protein [Acetobacteraceae bacterium]